VYAVHPNFSRNLSMIVHYQRDRTPRSDLVERRGDIGKFVHRFAFSAQLNHIDAALDHLLRDPIAIPQSRDIAQINDAVEMAIV